MKNIRPLLSVLVTATVALAQATALADSAANIQTYASGSAATYDDNGSGNYPIVTAILSAPHGTVYNPGATLDGYTYNNWAYLAADTTGSLDMFYSSTAAGPAANYPTLPKVGDTILVQGTYSPFDGIPEIENGTAQAINVYGPGSQGNAPYPPGAPVRTTIPVINVGTTLPAGGGVNASGLAGTLLELDNVTISGAGTTWAVHANTTATITDQSANSMVLYLWASSYSTAGAIAVGGITAPDPTGAAVPTGLVDMTGFVDDFYSTVTLTTEAEFVPISITQVPEPSAMVLCGLGFALAGVGYRLRKKA
jgi:hypothetical protein